MNFWKKMTINRKNDGDKKKKNYPLKGGMGKTANKGKIKARIKKVLKVKLENPTDSQAELAKKANVTRQSLQRDLVFLKKDGQLIEDTMLDIQDMDLEILLRSQQELTRRLAKKSEAWAISARDISVIAKESQARFSFLKGENVNPDGGEKKIDCNVKADPKGLAQILKEKLNDKSNK